MNGNWLRERKLHEAFCNKNCKYSMMLDRDTNRYNYVDDGSDDAAGYAETDVKQQQKYREMDDSAAAAAAFRDHLTPKQFLNKYSLPRIVKIVTKEPVCQDPISLLGGKLLIYRQYRAGKIEAKKCCDNNHRNCGKIDDNIEDEPTVVIPDTYQGWFSVVTERGQVKARLYTTIQRLIVAQVTTFLTIGMDIVGYVQNKKITDGSNHHYSKCVVKSGQILKLLAVFEDVAEQTARSKRLSWPLLGNKQHSAQYAQCVTSNKQVIYIPLNTHGNFYAVSTANHTAEDNVSKVYQIAKLLRVFPLPVRVCDINLHKNNGSLLLENYRKEEVILACALNGGGGADRDDSKFRFVEIDVASKFFLRRVPDEERLFKSLHVQEALRHCYQRGEKWCQQLKIIRHIYPSKGGVEIRPPGVKTGKVVNVNAPAPPQLNGRDREETRSKKSKKGRKISLGDKKTVKSASFRYATSYGTEDCRSPMRHCKGKILPSPPPAVVFPNAPKNVSGEECCSSLPAQKSSNATEEIFSRCEEGRPKLLRNISPPVRRLQMLAESKIVKQKSNKNNNPSNHNATGGCEEIGKKMRDLVVDEKYKVIKKSQPNYNEIKAPSTSTEVHPYYKMKVEVKIEESYSNTVDAIRDTGIRGNFSANDIYAEINDYTSSSSSKFRPVDSSKDHSPSRNSSYFTKDKEFSYYMRSPSIVNIL